MSDAIKEANAARRFPKNTCPASRLVQQIGEALVKGEPYSLLTDSPNHCGESMLDVVTALYKARTERDALRQALHDCDVVARARGDKYGLCDQIDNGGSPYPSQWLADLLAQAKEA